MSYTLDTPLGEIASAFPASTRVFEARGLDYCCGGQRPLREAAAAAGVAPEKVLDDLADLEAARIDAGPDWRRATAGQLIDHLVEVHHAYTRAEMARLMPLMTKVAGEHGERHPELLLIRATVQDLFHDLGPHLMKEERVLFPYIRALEEGRAAAGGFGSVANPIHAMEHEHDLVSGDLLLRIRDVSRDFALPGGADPVWASLYDGLAALEADLHQHIHLENNVLFPKALALEAGR